MCMCVYNVSIKAKERVLKKENHQIMVENKLVTIFLEPTKNPMEKNARPRTSFLPQSQERVRSGEKHQNEEHIPYVMDSCLQKVRFERRSWEGYVPAPSSPFTIPFTIDLTTTC